MLGEEASSESEAPPADHPVSEVEGASLAAAEVGVGVAFVEVRYCPLGPCLIAVVSVPMTARICMGCKAGVPVRLQELEYPF